MRFYIIYSVEDERADEHKPNAGEWLCTEDEMEQYDIDVSPEGYEHRKWTAELNREDFDSFIDQSGLIADDIQTMGSLTIEHGWLPAILFRDEDLCANAYVTPFPEPVRRADAPLSDRHWERVRKVVTSKYGY